MLSEAAKATVDAAEQRRSAFLRDGGPLFDSRLGARTIGDLALIAVGCQVYTKKYQPGQPTDTENVRMDSNGDGRGGIVVEITDSRHVDDEGTITQQRAFRCFDIYKPVRLGYTTITEAQIDLDTCMPADAGLTCRVIRRYAAEIAGGRGPLNTFHGQVAADMFRLIGVLLQRGHQ